VVLVTVAVNVTAAPKGAGFGDAVRVVVVGAVPTLIAMGPEAEVASIGDPL
jgi:hypothetical protein